MNSADVVGLCQKIIRFKSVNPPGCEKEVALFVANLLEQIGLSVEVIDHGSQRASVLAAMHGAGERPGILYTGHLDVVPADPSEWSIDPFCGDVSAGRIWGRGASDMKGGVAAIIAAAQNLAQMDLSLKGDLLLAFTAGEETDCLGAGEIVKRFNLKPVQGIFIAEPSENDVYIAEKGALWLEISTKGRAAHISRIDEGRNAILMMAQIIQALNNQNYPAATDPLVGRFLRSVNTITGGDKTNTIPSSCVVTVDQRTVPGQSHEEILGDIRKLIVMLKNDSSLPDFQADVRVLLDHPPLATSDQEPIVQTFYDIVGRETGRAQFPKGVGYFTDAVKFSPVLEAPFMICGPGNPKLNHQADEWIAIDKLNESVRIYTQTAINLLT